jgi:hypothetical protein
MADISQDAVLPAAWLLMHRAGEAGSGIDRNDTSGQFARHSQDGRQANTNEAVRELIAAYLFTPTHISSTFHSW